MLPVLVLCLQIFGGSDFKTLQGGQHFSKTESEKVGKEDMAKCKTSVLILSVSLQLIETKSVGKICWKFVTVCPGTYCATQVGRPQSSFCIQIWVFGLLEKGVSGRCGGRT